VHLRQTNRPPSIGARALSAPTHRLAARTRPAPTLTRPKNKPQQKKQQLALPYWQENPDARWRLAGVVALTLGTTGVSVLFNFLGRDFFNALAEKDADRFARQLAAYLGGFAVGVPVYVLRSYFQSRLALEWREGMTRSLLARYMRDRTFYQLAAGGGPGGAGSADAPPPSSSPPGTTTPTTTTALATTALAAATPIPTVDNPDQRIASDVRSFTDTCLSLALTLLNAGVDLVSFSGILFGIYPPLFAALLVYALGGTAISLRIGRPLVALNFSQEAREADLRYSLVRVRENAEAVAFYGGERAEETALRGRLSAAVDNYGRLLVASRNLDFFTSFYRFLIQLLPAAVVAPLFFAGKIEFGVVNQSQSAFGHVLSDVSLVVYQLEALAGFSAVVDRLGEFSEVVDRRLKHDWSDDESGGGSAVATATASLEEDAAGGYGSGSGIRILHVRSDAPPLLSGEHQQQQPSQILLELDGVSVCTPDGRTRLVRSLSLGVRQGESLLVMGPSGTGKTSVLRVLAGLWSSGEGRVYAHGLPGLGRPGNAPPPPSAANEQKNDDDDPGAGRVLFLPQKPYMVLGSLRDQLLYPTWETSAETRGKKQAGEEEDEEEEGSGASSTTTNYSPRPSDDELVGALVAVQLGGLLDRCAAAAERAAAAAAERAAALAAAAAAADGAASSPPPPPPPPSSPLDLVADWAAILSLGEQQRLAFARLLLAKPRLALLDEATSALDVANEARVYRAARSAGVTLVSVGHRPTLARFHERVLRLAPPPEGSKAQGCSWRVDPAHEVIASGFGEAEAAAEEVWVGGGMGR
jgi:ABC-type uncharacterized transport system fused permease/ATPase subunit